MTKGGYWLVKILDADAHREIEDDNRDLLKNKALNDWISSLRDDPENEVDDSYLTDEKKMWAVNKALEG